MNSIPPSNVRGAIATRGGFYRAEGSGPVELEFTIPGRSNAGYIIQITSTDVLAEGILAVLGDAVNKTIEKRLPPANRTSYLVGHDIAGMGRQFRIQLTHFSDVFHISIKPARANWRARVSDLLAEARGRAKRHIVAPLLSRWRDFMRAARDFTRKMSRRNTRVLDVEIVEIWGEAPKRWTYPWEKASSKQIAAHFAWLTALAARESPALAFKSDIPEISIVTPTYNTPPRYFRDLLKSMRAQRSRSFELILSDDGSSDASTVAWLRRMEREPNVIVVRNVQNRGISAATNAGLERARGKWATFVDHDDALAPFAIDRILHALRENPDCTFLYTDELIADERLRALAYFFKPAWDPVLLSGVNYINHLAVYRLDRLAAMGGLRAGFDGSQDYDLVLRYTAGLRPEEILHLPYPAYVWRRGDKTYSAMFHKASIENARRALRDHYAGEHPGIRAAAAGESDLHRIDFAPDRSVWPLVSIVMPSRDGFDLVSRSLDGICNQTDYPNLEVIVIDNGTTDQRVLDLYDEYRSGARAFEALVGAEPFNFSRSINRGFARARGDYVLLANNDLEVLEPGWLKEMVSCFQYEGIGIVGAKLLYPDRTIQHAGIIVGLGDLAGHWYVGEADQFPGPMGRLRVRESMTAVTGACLLVSRECSKAVGPFDEINFAIAYNDVDFCMRARELGFGVVWTPFAVLTHHESASRGSDQTPANIERFQREQANLQRLHGTRGFEDPFLNPWYGKTRADPSPAWLGQLPRARAGSARRRASIPDARFASNADVSRLPVNPLPEGVGFASSEVTCDQPDHVNSPAISVLAKKK